MSAPPTNDPPEARLLVVDDEPNIVELLTMTLRMAGFEVASAANGREAVRVAQAMQPDVVLLDVMIPDLDGFGVLRRLRGEGESTPVIFLTARDATEDKVAGLTMGADDYITKPFSLEEVIARVRVTLRKNRMSGPARDASRVSVADIELDTDRHEVRKAGTLVTLSPTEFRLLSYFMRNVGRVLSKSQIIQHVWEDEFEGDVNIVESYMSTLRKKVDTTDPRLLHTLRSVGYVMRVPRS
jgi:two-component system OmpR family response regulator